MRILKKAGVGLLLIALLCSEAYLIMAFLPMPWQRAIQRVFPESWDNSKITHPDIEGEIDQVLHHHLGVRVLFYTILVLLLAGNTWMLIAVVKKLRRMSGADQSRQLGERGSG